MTTRCLATLTSVIVAVQAACSTVQPVERPGSYIAAWQPDRVWITRADETVLLVEGPTVMGDSLLGFVDGRFQVVAQLPDLRGVAVRRPAHLRTALLAGSGAVTMVTLAIVLSGGGNSPYMYCRDGDEGCDSPTR